MKVEARVLDVTSTLEGERVGMTIDEGALAHIMSVLTDLYSDPEMAVIREYSTNAFDAHIEAGVDRPIEVTTPTQLAPFFKVRDFGFGLDAEDIRNIYSRYGTSTKRDSNDVVGMLGLGCKSALTYTDQFTLRGIKDGVCTQVIISRDEDGSGSMTIVDEYETDEDSGVEVVVPARQHNGFDHKSKDFFRFWDKGTVLVDEMEPKRIDGMWIADDLLLTEDTDESYVVMGNVAYPVPSEGFTHGKRFNTVAFVEIGAVQFTPSREALQMTAKTKAALADVRARVEAEKQAALERIIESSTTHQEALNNLLAAKRMGYKGKGEWRGKEIPIQFARNQGTDQRFIVVRGIKYKGQRDWSRESIVQAGNSKFIWLVNYEGTDWTASKRAKLDQWVAEKELEVGRDNSFILIDTLPDTEWIPADQVFDYAEVNAQKIARKATTQSGRPPGSYKGYQNGLWLNAIEADTIDASKPIFFVKNGYDSNSMNIVRNLHGNDFTYVILGNNRIAKFKRDFPTAQEINEYVKKAASDWQKSLTKADKLAIHAAIRRDFQALRTLDENEVNDPALREAIAASKGQQALLDKYNLFRYTVDVDLGRSENPLDKYPLLTRSYQYGSISGAEKIHVYLYVNAVFAAGKDN